MAENTSDYVENFMYLFSRETELDKLMGALCNSFGIEWEKGQSRLQLQNNAIIMQVDVLLENMGEEYQDFVKEQRAQVSWYFAQRENCDEDIKVNLIHHILQSKAFIAVKIISKREEEEAVFQDLNMMAGVMTDVIKKVDGVLVTDNGYTAVDKEGKVILSEDGDSELEFYFPFEYISSPKILGNLTERQMKRRNENMKYLFERHIYVCELPVNGDDEKITLRTKEEVAKRILGSLAVSLYSEAMLNPEEQMTVQEARAFVIKAMEDYNIHDMADILTEDELEYFQDDDADESTKIQFSWQYEHLYTLEWIMGLVEWEEPTDICNVPLSVRCLNEFTSVEDICNKTTMRSKKEILDKADLIYRMDWAAVDARIHRLTAPAGLDGGVTQARHKTLNWMICYGDAEWDDVDTPT